MQAYRPVGQPKARFSIQKLAYFSICLCIVLGLLYIGASFFIPVVYGIFLAFLLKPVCDWFEKGFRSRVIAILVTLVTVFIVVSSILTFFIVEITGVITEAENILANLQNGAQEFVSLCADLVGMKEREVLTMFRVQLDKLTVAPIGILTSGLTTSGAMLANFSLIIIYTFFFLLYSTALKRFLLGQLRGATVSEGETTIREIQGVATSYLGGMVIVMLILGVLNSLGLYLIGVRYALVWGFLGGLLAVIPYVGTFIGGTLPFIYAVATLDTYWQPIAVIVLYVTVQSIEGNLITPKVVGNSVKINALAAIVSLIFGALFWGIAGVILAIPLLAMLRTILDHIDSTKPLALLLSDDLYNDSDKFLNEYADPKYRLNTLFRGGKVIQVQQLEVSTGEIADEVGKTDAEVVPDTKAD